jgi:hypothetical protein
MVSTDFVSGVFLSGSANPSVRDELPAERKVGTIQLKGACETKRSISNKDMKEPRTIFGINSGRWTCRRWKKSRMDILVLLISLSGGCQFYQEPSPTLARSAPPPHLRYYDEGDYKQVGLPVSAAQRIIGSKPFWLGIVDVQQVKEERRPEGDLLGVPLSIAQYGRFEGVYHTVLVLRKNTADPDWSKARIYRLTSSSVFSVQDLFALPWKEIWRHVERDS